jgi:ABC-type bacteriocin/lantibiotic exporter with double-glycine peptidase domain
MCIDHLAFFQAMIMVSENPYIHGGKVEKNMAEHNPSQHYDAIY